LGGKELHHDKRLFELQGCSVSESVFAAGQSRPLNENWVSSTSFVSRFAANGGLDSEVIEARGLRKASGLSRLLENFE
jgi:hypothetical protein